ncbi:MAG: restriction endonuclease [Comamonadaceae bacterium]|nr:MAG: restriction endonuclease [Comamonadaceae bacterium]
MGAMHRRSGKDPARQVLGMAIPFLALGGALWLASWVLARSDDTLLQPLAESLRVPVPWLLLAGALLLAAALGMRLRHGAPPASRLDSSHMPSQMGNTTLFGSQLDSRLGDLVAEPSRPRRPPAQAWNTQVFRDIEWQRFEAVCTILFGQAGYEIRSAPQGADGGADIWLYSAHADRPAAMVRSLHRPGKKVALKEVQAFREAMASHGLPQGTFATSGTFSAEARAFAKANGVNALDRLALLAMISQRTAQQKNELLDVAYQGEYWRPTCVNCGTKMVERRARKKGRTFWGCTDYPRCNFMLPVQEARGPQLNS